MNKAHELNEIQTLRRSLGAIAFASISVFPMIVLGWLVSAVARTPVADKALQGEAVYTVIDVWMGGTGSLPVVLLLMFLLISLVLFAYLLSSLGYGEAVDGMSFARTLIQKLLLPLFLSSSGFMAGIVGGATLASLARSLLVFVVFALFAGALHYFVDTVSVSPAPKRDA